NVFVAGFLGSPSMNFIPGQLRLTDGRVEFDSAGFKLDLSTYAFAVPPNDAQSVVLGVRPEHLRMVPPDAPHNSRATLGLIEPMGSNKIVWLDASGTRLALQTEPSVTLVSGEKVHLAMDPAH